ncbi:HamA C-terminal domain-containing protein [Fulvivirga lutea]|uniref:DUF1837 domain-containing protein n=1 Tax=Fulvivirga lutea TaxID=2810512 RepID=A0A975A2X4_9BACT|nr:DUF1837 domain-containing protein [Fulvivirga lutea]QSE98997.1 DUF1837 domain-containing protein [Fulvivirga lutea]
MKKTIVDFEVLVDDFFLKILPESSLVPAEKKKLLSIINDYQDGKWRYGKFQSFVWDNITETSLSLKDRQALLDRSQSSLTEAAKRLRLTDLKKDQDGQGSELAEIVLYGIMKHNYNALPVVPKIFYKQNSQDNAKGADSVHIVIEDEDSFSLWFGEAKFYNSIEDERLYSIVNSVENSLQTEKLEKENSIITNVNDLKHYLKDNKTLYDKIVSFIRSGVSIDNLKPKLHIPILILHECSITKSSKELTDEYRYKIIELHKERAESYFKKQINKVGKSIFKYDEVHFHLILFPVAEKKPIIDSFVKNVQHYKEQAS